MRRGVAVRGEHSRCRFAPGRMQTITVVGIGRWIDDSV